MKREELLDNIRNVMVSTQIGALLSEIVASVDEMHGDKWSEEELLDAMRLQCLHILTAVESIADIVTEHLYDSADADQAYEHASSVKNNIVKRISYLED